MDFFTFSKMIMTLALFEPVIIYAACWPSSRNLVLTHYLPFTLLPLIGGIFYFFDYRIGLLAGADPYLESLLLVLVVGAAAHAIAFYLSFRVETPLKDAMMRLMERVKAVGHEAPSRLVTFVTVLAIVSSALQLYAYAKMGFAPLFAADPLSAKFYSGQYQEGYAPVAPFLRLGFQIYVSVAPLFMVCLPKGIVKRIAYFFLVATAAGTILLSLKRGPLALPFVDFALTLSVFYKKGRYSAIFMIAYIGIFAFGAAANGILFYVIGLRPSLDPEVIFSGVPDISDLLMFWSGFQSRHYDLSLGRTVLGALIPYRYEWNPSVVTKLAIGATADIATGGLRLPDAVWGYVAFGYVGAVVWPAFAGAVSGIQASLLRSIVNRPDLSFFQFYMMYFVMCSITGFAASALAVSLDSLTALAFAALTFKVMLGGARGNRASIR